MEAKAPFPEAIEAPLLPREAALVREGIPELPLEALSLPASAPAGLPLRLTSRGRSEVAGIGIADPDRGVLRIWSRGPARLDAAFFEAKLDAALERRRELIDSGATEAWRVIHGDGDGLSGMNVDAWGPYLTVEAFGRGPALWAPLLEEALDLRLHPQGMVEKLVLPEANARAARAEGITRERGKVEERLARGERPPDPLVVREHGVPFAVRLLGTRHEGLFPDLREERRRLASLSPKRLLNLFAYTGSFSVAAARSGATTTTVDIVAKVLEWAKENFRLSGIDTAHHHFARMDAGEFLALAGKRGWTYDAIVLDPPTFARAGGRSWSLARDYPGLVAGALRVLEPDGRLWAVANAAAIADGDHDRWIAEGAAAAGREVREVVRGCQPSDFPAPPGFPRYRYLKVKVLTA